MSFGTQVLTTLVPAVLLGLAASRRIADLRRSGALELLLCTPLSGASLTRAEWDVLWHAMRWPLAVLGLLLALPTALLYMPGSWSPSNVATVFLVTQLIGIAKTILTAIATVWLGLWFGLRARTPALAVGRTVIWIVLVPFVATSVFSLLHAWFDAVVPRASGAPWAWYGLYLLSSALGAIYAVALILWARRRLSTRFRALASEP
jgi:MFS family permease